MPRKSLLIVEDNARFRLAVKDALSRVGYDLFEADSVAAANSQLSLNPSIQVILLDLSLGNGSGVELLQQIEPRASQYRVIILTGHEEQLAAEEARKFAVFRYLSKAVKKTTESIRFAVRDAFDDLEHGPHPVKVFVSYTNPDFEKVNWVYRRLKDHRFVPWLDKIDLRVGYTWDKAIEDAIADCDCVLSCLSDIAVKRLGYFQKETRLAVARYDKVGDPFIIPLRFDNCALPKEFVKRKIQHLTYDSLHDDWWEKLVWTLRSIDIRGR